VIILQGYIMLKIHGTCVAIGNEAILFRGPSGSGKSDLALRVINCGGTLVSDDQTIIVRQEDELIMSSPENIRDKIEVRGVGIVNMPAKKEVRLGLVLDMMPSEKIDRIPIPQFCWYLGLQVPVLGLHPFENSAPLKVQLAINSVRSSNQYAHTNTQ
jgi:HPr kinase/phosphorylase